MTHAKESTACITIEFTNLARVLVGENQIDMEISSYETYADVVERLGKMYPDLLGILIEPDGRRFMNSNMFIINNEMADPVMVMEDSPRPGDRLTLVSVATGG